MSRLTSDLVDQIESSWVIAVTRADDLTDAVERFIASENSHPAPGWIDDPARWRDCLRERALTLDFDIDSRSLIVIGPKSRERRYSAVDLELARELCAQVGNVLRRVAASLETARLEMESARRIQDRLSASGIPDVEGIECSGACDHSDGLGGDFYELLSPSPGQLLTLLGNVPTTGVSGSILMTALKTSVRSAAQHSADLANVVGQMNRSFWQTASDDAIAPIFAARIVSERRRIEYVNAGYQTAFVARSNGRIDRLETNSPALGLNGNIAYRGRSMPFEPGDILIAASDGVVEAAGPEGIELGERGLLQIVRDQTLVPTRELPSRIIDTIGALAGKAKVDRTIVAVGYRGRQTRTMPLEMAASRPLARFAAA